MAEKKSSFEELASLCKRRGYIFQGSEIYGGLAGTWDYGPLGVQLKRNITDLWWRTFVESRDDMYGIDSAILMNQKVWQASGHTGAGFADPLFEDLTNKKRYRADHLLEENGIDPIGMSLDQMTEAKNKAGLKSPDGNELSEARQFNMMFKTHVGPLTDDASISYLRPETAQGMFVNFKNVMDSFYPDLPFGIAQIGKAFRNEISPRDFTFRSREFEQMEIEYFVNPENWEAEFESWMRAFYKWFEAMGISRDAIHELEVDEADRAHYSKRTVDFEFDFPHDRKELYGLAYRTDFDLKNHSDNSGRQLVYRPKEGGEPFIPHCIEPTFGLDRTILAVLSSAYKVDEVEGEKREYLALPEALAPVKMVVSPLLKNKPELVEKAKEVYAAAKAKYRFVQWDDSGNIGKRYRKADEIGVPKCVVIDFQTLDDDTVTVRDRDTTEQIRISVSEL